MTMLFQKLVSFSQNSQVKQLLRQYERPNFWSIIEYGRQSYETRYSRMLRWLLDPTETHGLGNRFAELLLTKVTGLEKELLGTQRSGCDAEALSKNIDLFYYNQTDGITITIEVKVFSKDHANQNGTSQLDKYYKVVSEHPEYGNRSKYNQYFVFLTIDGSDPVTLPESDEAWHRLSYVDLIGLLNHLLPEIENLDVLKVVNDFKHDLEKIYSTSQLVLDELVTEFTEEDKKNIESLYFYLFEENQSDDSEIEFLYYQLKGELFNSHLDSRKLRHCLELLYNNFKVGKQNHRPNQSVQLVMRKVFNHYAEHQIEVTPLPVPKERRISLIKPDLAEKLGYKYIKITHGKGQGIALFATDDFDNSPSAYFSGDSKGKLFNVGLQLRHGEQSRQSKMEQFTDADFINSHDEAFISCLSALEKELEKGVEV